jgi:protein TonB
MLAVAAGAAAVGTEATPLFELVPVPPEYAGVPMATPTPAPHKRTTRRKAARPPPPPLYLPPSIAIQPPPPPEAIRPLPIAPPMPPMPTGRPATALSARGNPGSWVVNDDYPAAALRAGEAGTVGFRLYVDETGTVSACYVTSSSGSAILDNTTCSLMKRRARFNPARDAAGQPIPAYYSNRLRWEIPEESRVPATSWASTLRFTIGADGQLNSCSFQGYESPELSERSPCVEISEAPRATMRALRGRSRGPVTLVARFDHVVEGKALPRVPALPAKFKRIAAWTSSFEINLWGGTAKCVGNIDDHELPVPAVTCNSYTSYGPGFVDSKVTVTMSFFTDGDTGVAAALPRLATAGE